MNDAPIFSSAASNLLLCLTLTLFGFLMGSIPFSVLIGRVGAGVDIRQYGDHNPGSTNVLRAAGWRLAIPAFFLDYLKAALPVGIAWFLLGMQGAYIVPIALAPILGHAFSPWLKWHGGKAVAASLGTWTGLTIGAGPTVLGLLISTMYAVFTNSSWAMMLAMLAFGGFIIPFYGQSHPELAVIWMGNLIILLLKHWNELDWPPVIRPRWLHWRFRQA